MARFHCTVGNDRFHIDQATRLRALVFGRELGYVRGMWANVREIDPFDPLESTRHILLHEGSQIVGTARLLLPNQEVARACGTQFGLSIEGALDLSPLAAQGGFPAETTRVVVEAAHRGGRAMAVLYAALFEESLKNGVTHWVACANVETDSLQDAEIVAAIAQAQGLRDPDVTLTAHDSVRASPPSARRLFDEAQRSRARRGDIGGLRLPRTISLFTRTLGARVAGPPIYDRHFHMCSLPIVLPLGAVARRLTSGIHRQAA